VAITPSKKLVFLFGEENPWEDSAKGWSDFGGGIEKGETPWETARREGQEEWTGILGSVSQLLQHNGGRKLHLEHRDLGYGEGGGLSRTSTPSYHIYIVPIDYDETLPTHYNNMHAFIWSRMGGAKLNPTKIFEKRRIGWFTVDDIHRKIGHFRNFYQTILKQTILPAETSIRRFIRLSKMRRQNPPMTRRRRRRRQERRPRKTKRRKM
jgi:8-oxo-dGTP pyrophosphatase MutT (NUDIX family)